MEAFWAALCTLDPNDGLLQICRGCIKSVGLPVFWRSRLVFQEANDLLNAGDVARPSLELRREIRQRFAPETIAQQYLNLLVAQCELAGVLVMRSGLVGNDTRRKLDADEFQGFSITDDYAPLIFINGQETFSTSGPPVKAGDLIAAETYRFEFSFNGIES